MKSDPGKKPPLVPLVDLRKRLIEVLESLGLLESVVSVKRSLSCLGRRDFFLQSLIDWRRLESLMQGGDPVRYGAIFLAIERIRKSGIGGSFAEVGVYRGLTSRFVHSLAPERTYYLFDTFEGFPMEDLEGKNEDNRFDDTSLEIVQQTIGNLENVVFRKGYFPDTAASLENESFAFVMLDADLYKPTLAGLEFFYPRLVKGGYMFLHDYNSPESEWAVSRAADRFLEGKPEKFVEIPDSYGSILFRKI